MKQNKVVESLSMLKTQNSYPYALKPTSEGYRRLAVAELGVVGQLLFGVIGVLDIDPECSSGKLCGETDHFSNSILGIADVKEKVTDSCRGHGSCKSCRSLRRIDAASSFIISTDTCA